MSRSIRYVNSALETMDLSAAPVRIRLKTAGFNDYAWEPIEDQLQVGSRTNGFQKGAIRREMDVDFMGTPEERKAAMDRFYELTEYDIRMKNAGVDAIGRLYVDDDYMECYVIGSEAVYYRDKHRTIGRRCTLYAPNPYWVREYTTVMKKYVVPDGNSYLDYPYDFPHNYTPESSGERLLVNRCFAPCAFRLEIYGPAVNPTVTIAGVDRTVYATIRTGSRLEIDSRKKTVNIIDEFGGITNCFNKRKKSGESIFADIPPGRSRVSSTGNFMYTLTVLIERSELGW